MPTPLRVPLAVIVAAGVVGEAMALEPQSDLEFLTGGSFSLTRITATPGGRVLQNLGLPLNADQSLGTAVAGLTQPLNQGFGSILFDTTAVGPNNLQITFVDNATPFLADVDFSGTPTANVQALLPLTEINTTAGYNVPADADLADIRYPRTLSPLDPLRPQLLSASVRSATVPPEPDAALLVNLQPSDAGFGNVWDETYGTDAVVARQSAMFSVVDGLLLSAEESVGSLDPPRVRVRGLRLGPDGLPSSVSPAVTLPQPVGERFDVFAPQLITFTAVGQATAFTAAESGQLTAHAGGVDPADGRFIPEFSRPLAPGRTFHDAGPDDVVPFQGMLAMTGSRDLGIGTNATDVVGMFDRFGNQLSLDAGLTTDGAAPAEGALATDGGNTLVAAGTSYDGSGTAATLIASLRGLPDDAAYVWGPGTVVAEPILNAPRDNHYQQLGNVAFVLGPASARDVEARVSLGGPGETAVFGVTGRAANLLGVPVETGDGDGPVLRAELTMLVQKDDALGDAEIEVGFLFDPADAGLPSVDCAWTFDTADFDSSGFGTLEDHVMVTGTCDVDLDVVPGGSLFADQVIFAEGCVGGPTAAWPTTGRTPGPTAPAGAAAGSDGGATAGASVLIDDLVIRLTLLTAAIPGDYNASGLVEQGDLNQVLGNWGAAFDAVSAGWISQRPTEGIVDQAELNAVLNNWGAAAAPTAVGRPVPEPGTLAPLILLFTQRRSRTSVGSRRKRIT